MLAVQCETPLGLLIFINCNTHMMIFRDPSTKTWKADQDYCLKHSKAFHRRWHGATII